MKIGVFLGGDTPQTIGGGYTFTSNILSSLLNFVSNTSLNLIVFGSTKEVPHQLKITDQIQYVSLDLGSQQRLYGKLTTTRNAVFKKIQNPSSKFKIEPWRTQFILNSLASNGIDGIDLIWNFDS